MGRSKSIRNKINRAKNTPEVIDFCKEAGLKYKWIAGDWHLRIENVMDIYPGKKRYFFLPTQQWGYYEDYDDLGRIYTSKINAHNIQSTL